MRLMMQWTNLTLLPSINSDMPNKTRIILTISRYLLSFLRISGKIVLVIAAVAELADAQRSGRCILTGVQVRLLPAA